MNGFDLYSFLVHLFEFSWYTPMTGALGSTAGEVSFPNISVRDLNVSFCTFHIVNIRLSGAGLCSA